MSKKQYISPFFVIAFSFLIFGLLMIGDVSLIEAERNFGDRFYFLKRQAVWATAGVLLFVIAAAINFRFWKKVAFFLFVFSLFPLLLVLIPGIGQEVWGAKRWLSVGPIHFQPSELTRFSLLLYLAAILEKQSLKISRLLLILLPPVALTVLEPDFGTSTVMVATAFTLWFVSGARVKNILLPAVFFILLGILLIYISPYRRQRVASMLNPFYDPQGKSYHSYQLILTLGSGGIFGVGMGKSRQKYQYLPQVTTDSIMAVVGEEFGLAGLTLVLLVFLIMIWTGLKIALECQNSFGRLFTAGFISALAIQGLVNLSAIAAVLPLTGIPFPLVSYGGSSLVVTLLSLGIVFNIYQSSK